MWWNYQCLLEPKSLLNVLSEMQLKGKEHEWLTYQHSIWINQACGLHQWPSKHLQLPPRPCRTCLYLRCWRLRISDLSQRLFQGSALPLGHGSVCIDVMIFPGYWKTQAGWFIKEISTSSKVLRCQRSGSSSSNILQWPGFLELDLILSPSIVRVGICSCQKLLHLCHSAQQNSSFYIWLV